MRTVMFVQAVMTPRRLLFACLFLLLPALSEARCVIELRDVWRASAKTNPTGTVFQGVVRTVTKLPGGEVALLDVDRVWRGSTPRQITIYNVTGEVTPEGVELTLSTARRLAVGARYVIFTRQMSEAEGRMFGTTASATTLVAQGCGIFNVEQQDVRVLGRGRAPE